MEDSRVKKASDLVASLVSPEAAREGGAWAGFFSAWARVAGGRAAAHTRIVDVRQGLIIVEADHPGWIQTLQFRQGAILTELKGRFPALELRGIAFRTGKGAAGAVATGVPASPSEQNRSAWAEGSAGGIRHGAAALPEDEGEPAKEEREAEPAMPPELGELLAGLKRALSGSD